MYSSIAYTSERRRCVRSTVSVLPDFESSHSSESSPHLISASARIAAATAGFYCTSSSSEPANMARNRSTPSGSFGSAASSHWLTGFRLRFGSGRLFDALFRAAGNRPRVRRGSRQRQRLWRVVQHVENGMHVAPPRHVHPWRDGLCAPRLLRLQQATRCRRGFSGCGCGRVRSTVQPVGPGRRLRE